jgi:SHS2 domain-containing protein
MGHGRSGLVGHELVDHTSEVTVRLRAPTFAALLAEATRAFGDLVPEALRGEPDGGRRDFRIEGRDRAATLVDWLNEIVYSCEADQWLPVDVEVAENDSGLAISARGVSLLAPFVLVKAATLHNARVHEGGDGLEGEVTLDV